MARPSRHAAVSFELGYERGRCRALGQGDSGVLRLLRVEFDPAHPAGDEVVERRTDERGDESKKPVEDRQRDDRRRAEQRSHRARPSRPEAAADQREEADAGADDESQECIQEPGNLGERENTYPSYNHSHAPFLDWPILTAELASAWTIRPRSRR